MPWALLLRGGVVALERWHVLSEQERARFLALARSSRGRPGNLTAREREELRILLARLDVGAAGRDLLPIVRGFRRKRG